MTEQQENKQVTQVLPSWVAKLRPLMSVLASISPKLVSRFIAVSWFKPFMPAAKKHVKAWQATADEYIKLTKGEAFIFNGDNSGVDETKNNGNDQLDKRAKPLVVCVHGWRGRAFQMRRFLSPLHAQGFRVAIVNLPAHTDQDVNFTHGFECADFLVELKNKCGEIDSIIAHSFGCPVSTLALSDNFKLRKLVYIAGNFNIQYLLQQVCAAFDIQSIYSQVEQQVKLSCDRKIYPGSWDDFQAEKFIQQLQFAEQIMFFHDPKDSEICIKTNDQIYAAIKPTGKAQIKNVTGVGHFDILRSQAIIDDICRYICD